MIKEILPSIRNNFKERLGNPIIGTFAMSWVFCNWRTIVILLFSDKSIEKKIETITSNYSEINLILLYPLYFTIFYVFLMPWILYGVQILQEKSNHPRRRLRYETEIILNDLKLKSTIGELEIEQERLRHSLKNEFEQKSQELEIQREKSKYEFEIEKERKKMEFELEERKADYENHLKRRESEMAFENKMRELDYEEKRKRDNLELEQLKIRNENLKK